VPITVAAITHPLTHLLTKTGPSSSSFKHIEQMRRERCAELKELTRSKPGCNVNAFSNQKSADSRS